MRFQSKYRNHKLLMRTTRRYVQPGAVSPTIEPGITVEFSGVQRIFDSEKQGWDKKTQKEVEDWLLQHPKYGNGVYLAAGQQLTDAQLGKARVKPKATKRFCEAIGIGIDGKVEQCPNEPAVGQKFCFEHDPDQGKVTRGLQTTVD